MDEENFLQEVEMSSYLYNTISFYDKNLKRVAAGCSGNARELNIC